MININSNKQNQQTIRETISISGIGLHSGKQVEMKLEPAEVDQGVKFIRSDKKNNNVIDAIWSNVSETVLNTTISNGSKLKISPKEILKNYNKVKKINKNKNCVIGFGITNKSIKSFKNSDGVVVGSEICKEISRSLNNRQNPVTNVSKIVTKLKNKIL